MVVSDLLNRLRETIELVFNQSAISQACLSGIASVQALELSDGVHVVIESEGKVMSSSVQSADLKIELDGIPLQWWFRNASGTMPVTKPVLPLHDTITIDDVEVDIRIGPEDFVQGHAEGNRQMIGQIIEWSQDARFVVDLFSGVGNLSLSVAKVTCARVLGAELNRVSVQAANTNAKRLGLDAQYSQVNLFETFDAELYAGADLIILDPPRRGANKVCEMMGRLLPARIVMVNCDPASGGRDAGVLHSLGYRLHTLRALDIFPYAGHVEAMSLWVR